MRTAACRCRAEWYAAFADSSAEICSLILCYAQSKYCGFGKQASDRVLSLESARNHISISGMHNCCCTGLICALMLQLGTSSPSHLTSTAAVKLLSSSGQQLALRSQDLRTPFCVWLAAQAQGASASSTASFSGPGLESMRRYEISQVYMHNEKTPKWLAAIDIVRAGTDLAVSQDAPMLAEAELIRMVCDVCSSVEALKGCSVDIQLSHASLLVGVLDHVGVDASVQHSFLQALQALMANTLPGEKGHAAVLKSKAWATFCQQLQQLNLPVGRAKPLLLSLPTDPCGAVKWCASHDTGYPDEVQP